MNQVLDKEKLIQCIKSSELPHCLTQYEIDSLNECINESIITGSDSQWIPCKERLPEECERVQVTYLGYYDRSPYCDGFAYVDDFGTWFWQNSDEEVEVPIVAWKPNCEPYKGD